MTLVFDKGQLLVEMKTPAANMLGFEHKPNSDKQWNTLEKVEKNLRNPKTMITLTPECELKNSSVNLPFQRSVHNSNDKLKTKVQHSDEHHHSEKHREKERHHEEEKHHHEQHHGDEEHESGHTDISVQYEWLCTKPIAPTLTLRYFDEFPSFEHISVESIVDGSQGVTQLNKNKKILKLAQ